MVYFSIKGAVAVFHMREAICNVDFVPPIVKDLLGTESIGARKLRPTGAREDHKWGS